MGQMENTDSWVFMYIERCQDNTATSYTPGKEPENLMWYPVPGQHWSRLGGLYSMTLGFSFLKGRVPPTCVVFFSQG